MVTDVSETRRGDREFFGRLWSQMTDSGGLEAMVHDLLELDLSGWHPSMIPHTEALADQKLASADPATRFWLQALTEGVVPGSHEPWPSDTAITLDPDQKNEAVGGLDAFIRVNRLGARGRATHRALTASGGRLFGLESLKAKGNSIRVWQLPSLTTARDRFQQALGSSDLFD